jgi:hypothetical protein
MRRKMQPETHISSFFFNLSFDFLWEYLTDPLNFPEIYPNWTSQVTKAENGEFLGIAPTGDSFTIVPQTNYKYGIIDFKIIDELGKIEWSRSRVFPLKTGGCIYIHLAVRWDGVDDDVWREHQKLTDKDLEHAKTILEQRFHNDNKIGLYLNFVMDTYE